MSEKKKCFFISPIGKADSPERKNSDEVMKFILEPVLSDTYDIRRADQLRESGPIFHQIVRSIRDWDLVIADLSGYNANVFYELAIAHALSKPVVHLITKSQPLPFDVTVQNTIHYSLQVADVEATKADLRKFVASMGKGIPVENPITTVIEFDLLKTQGNPSERAFASVFASLESLGQTVNEIHGMVATSLQPRQAIRLRAYGSPRMPSIELGNMIDVGQSDLAWNHALSSQGAAGQRTEPDAQK